MLDPLNARSGVLDGSAVIFSQLWSRTLLMHTQIYGSIHYAMCRCCTAGNPPTGFQVIYVLYFKHFRVLPLPQIMSKILLIAGIVLSQIRTPFYLILCGFINVCINVGVLTIARLLFHFMKIRCVVGKSDRSCMDAKCLNVVPLNLAVKEDFTFEGEWVEIVFFFSFNFAYVT